MVRMVYCAMRKEAVSLREFRGYFDGEHKELVCDLARALQAVDFRQSLTLMIEENFAVMVERGTGMPYDGVIELWWDNSADLEQAMSTEEAQLKAENLFRQADQFIDFAKSRIFFTEQPQSCKH